MIEAVTFDFWDTIAVDDSDELEDGGSCWGWSWGSGGGGGGNQSQSRKGSSTPVRGLGEVVMTAVRVDAPGNFEARPGGGPQ